MTTIKKGTIVEYVGKMSEFCNSLATVLTQEGDMYTIQFRDSGKQETVQQEDIQKVN